MYTGDLNKELIDVYFDFCLYKQNSPRSFVLTADLDQICIDTNGVPVLNTAWHILDCMRKVYSICFWCIFTIYCE